MVFVLCSCFSFFILLLHVLSWALLTFLILYFCASRTFSLASLDNVSLASLDKVSLATIGFFTSCQQSSLTLRTSFKTLAVIGSLTSLQQGFLPFGTSYQIWDFYLRIGSLASLQRPQPWQEFNANRFFKNLLLPAANQPFSKLCHLSSSQLCTNLHLLLSTNQFLFPYHFSSVTSIPNFISLFAFIIFSFMIHLTKISFIIAFHNIISLITFTFHFISLDVSITD